MRPRFVFALVLLVGCGSSAGPSGTPASVDGGVADGELGDGLIADGALDTPADAKIDKSATCAPESAFGTALTNSFGRADGVVTAVVGPTVTTCAWPNDDHVVLQIEMNGAIYRMVINIASTRGTDLRVRFATIDHAALEPWSEGWHPGVTLDYPSMLGLHAGAGPFVPYDMLPLAEKVEAAIDLGTKVSVYSWSSGGTSAHKIHRNATNGDGAIVVDPGGTKPRWLVFHFADQTF